MYNAHVIVASLVNGALLGLVYALVAIGFTLLMGVMRYVNFAHGQLMMLTMFVALFLFQSVHIDPFLAIPLDVIASVLLSLLIYFVIGRRALSGGEPAQIIATLGLMLLIQNIVTLIWGPTGQAVTISYTTSVYHLFTLSISRPLLWAAAVSVVVVLALFFLLQRTEIGKAIRATAFNPTAATLMGINPRAVFLGAMLLAGALEAIAGGAIMPISVISPFVGFDFLLKAFVIVVMTGMGQIGGALVVSIGYGMLESVANLFIGSQLSTAAIFMVLIVTMLARPAGFFGRRGVEHVG